VLARGKEGTDTTALQFVPLDLPGLRVDRVDLKHALGNIHSDDGQMWCRLHGGASGVQVVQVNLHFGTSMPLPRGSTVLFSEQRSGGGDIGGDVHVI